tara:strand:- start:5846 stop:6175 length:330 start_codon:yes stop_codon:yes gene_type:complete
VRIHDILCEDIETEVAQSLKQMFIPYLANKTSKVSMDMVLKHMKELHGQYYDVSSQWVMNTLTGSDFVKRVTPDHVYLDVDTPESVTSTDESEKAQDHVAKMAKRSRKI